MVSIQSWLPEYDYSTRNAQLAPVYADFERQKEFYQQRRKQTQEVVDMLTDRVEAELTYAMRLDKISNQPKSFQLGNLAEEVQNFQIACSARARQAAEVSENVHQDCITPLKSLIENQDAEYNKVLAFARKKQDKLHEIDADIKKTALAYFKAAQRAEDSVVHYQKIKYEADLNYVQRQQAYDVMMQNLMELKDNEVEYKETVDTANNFVQKFRRVILKYCRACRDLEIDRSNAIHSSINQFVVFEMSAEMNNKYDTANFAKVLEEFSVEQEMQCLDQHLYGIVQAATPEDYEEQKARGGDRSTTDKERSSRGGMRDSFADSTTSLTSETAPELTNDGQEPQEDFRTHDQLCKEIQVMPNAFVPVVSNINFEFVPFESRLHEEKNPIINRIDINQLTQVQLREPPARISTFYRPPADSQQEKMNGEMTEEDKRELIFFILQKVFCIGQQWQQMSKINKEYVQLVEFISAASPVDRNLLVNDLRGMFQGRQTINEVVFKNLISVVTAIYDSYLPPEGKESGHKFDLTDLQATREFTQQYFMQASQKQSPQTIGQPLMMTPCLEGQLKHHKIWSFPEVWFAISKDLEIFTILGIQFFQDQMASYEVVPELLQQVTLRLIQEMRGKQQRGDDSTDTTSMSSDAEQGCHNRIEQYRQMYNEKQEEKQRQAILAKELQQQKAAAKGKGRAPAKPGPGLSQSISTLVGGFFSGGGLRQDSQKMNKNSSPTINHRTISAANAQQMSNEPLPRPSLAALLSGATTGRGSVQITRKKSPAERRQSAVDEIPDDLETHSINRHASTTQIIVKRANYVSHTESKQLRLAGSRSPQRSPGLFTASNASITAKRLIQQQANLPSSEEQKYNPVKNTDETREEEQ